MNKTLRTLLIWILLLSPVWMGLLGITGRTYGQSDPVLMFKQITGVVAIGIIGLTVSICTRKLKEADKLSIAGYAVPAIVVCGYLFSAVR